MYDYIIIGGGIAGLYANYLLNKDYNGLLLEQNKHFGGRAFEMDFHGTLIKLGAGIMADHNIHLLALLKELNIYGFVSKIEDWGTFSNFNQHG